MLKLPIKHTSLNSVIVYIKSVSKLIMRQICKVFLMLDYDQNPCVDFSTYVTQFTVRKNVSFG